MSKHSQNHEKKVLKEEPEDKKSIILILIAIVAVIALIFCSLFLFNTEDKELDDGEKVDVIEKEPENTETGAVVTVTSGYKIVVKYMDADGKQLGKTQKLISLDDRINEKAPKVEGYRFSEWVMEYDKTNKIYYFYSVYVQVVEKVEETEDKYLSLEEETLEKNDYIVTISDVRMPEDELTEEEIIESAEAVTRPTYEVEVSGGVAELNDEEKSEDLTISSEYHHIIALRVNAPEGITKENINKMTINVSATDEEETLETDEYHYNGEDTTKVGRELLDSTDEEYENDIFYFNYYQEVDTKTNSTIEVYWGNDEEANTEAETPIEPRDEYVEEFNINVENVELETEVNQ